MPVDNKEVVVLVMSYRTSLSEFERISLEQCLKVLGNYPIHIVKPSSIDISSWGLEAEIGIDNFHDDYFKDIGAYSRLLLSPGFYKRYLDYKYILIYQLDAFVFRDELNQWCSTGFDYIGAPWFEQFSNSNPEASFIKGGNGGFSLRKVKAHLKVLQSLSYISQPAENWRKRTEAKPSGLKLLHEVAGFVLDMTVRNNTFSPLNSFKGFEDQFWCLVAAKNFPWFSIPDYRQEMNFAMEMQPRRVYEMNERKLPFGCHAWWKYDLEFWKPFIKQYGHELV